MNCHKHYKGMIKTLLMPQLWLCKQELQIMRESGWSSLHDEVSCFGENNNIDIPNIDDICLTRGRP